MPTAAQQLQTFIAKYTPEVSGIAKGVLAKMRKRFVGTQELVYDNYNALAIAYSPTGRVSDVICSFALSTSLPLSLVLLFLGGIFFMALFSISFSIVQLAVPDALRGRVVSIYMVALRGGGPIGGVAAGALADRLSTSTVMATNGILHDAFLHLLHTSADSDTTEENR